MSRNEITMRLLSAEARVPLQHMRNGQMRDDDWTRIARDAWARSPRRRCSSTTRPNMSMMEIRAKCRRLKQRHDLKLVVIDYLQLMTSASGSSPASRRSRSSPVRSSCWPRSSRSRSSRSRQLNRGPEQRTDKRPQMTDLRESGSIEQDADMVDPAAPRGRATRRSPRARARPTSSWPSTETARPTRSSSPSRATTAASPTWRPTSSRLPVCGATPECHQERHEGHQQRHEGVTTCVTRCHHPCG